MPDHARHMARAVQLAGRGWYTSAPNPRVGCVLVRDGQVIGEGWHVRAGEPHAEIRALRDAQSRNHVTAGATAYVTLEPCSHHGRTPPCADALIEARVTRVVLGAQDPNPAVDGRGMQRLREAGIEVVTGVAVGACEQLNPGFNQRMQTGRPRLRVKLAMTLDGRTAAADGSSQWITGARARADVHRLRAESGAVMVGSGTVLADDPSLSVRLDGDWPQPLRVVLDSRLRTPTDARMLGQPGTTRIYTACKADSTQWLTLETAGAALAQMPADMQGLRIEPVLDHLGKLQINDVLVEAGATLAGSLAAQRLVDEYIIYMAPQFLGDMGRGLLRLPGVQSLQQRIDLRIEDISPVGNDWRILARPASKPDD